MRSMSPTISSRKFWETGRDRFGSKFFPTNEFEISILKPNIQISTTNKKFENLHSLGIWDPDQNYELAIASVCFSNFF